MPLSNGVIEEKFKSLHRWRGGVDVDISDIKENVTILKAARENMEEDQDRFERAMGERFDSIGRNAKWYVGALLTAAGLAVAIIQLSS